MTLRVVVFGGRTYFDYEAVRTYLDAHYGEAAKAGELVVIEGDAPGADKAAGKWAKANGVKPLVFPAAWSDLSHPDALIKTRKDGTKYDARAGFRRNQRMVDDGKPNEGVAFPGGDGTADMVRRLERARIPVKFAP